MHVQILAPPTYEMERSKFKLSLRTCSECSAPINVMPQYPPYGQITGHIRGTDEKSVPHTGDLTFRYMHMRI